MLLFVMLGCTAGEPTTSANFADVCATTFEPVGREDASLGFTAADVLSFLTLHRPTQISWDEWTAGQESASMELVFGEITGDVSLVTNAPDLGACRAETALRVPLEVEVTLAGGEVTMTGTLVVDALALDEASIWPFSDLNALPATLSGSYVTQLEEHIAERDHPEEDIVEQVRFIGVGPWEAGAVELAVDYPSSLESVWRGHWGDGG